MIFLKFASLVVAFYMTSIFITKSIGYIGHCILTSSLREEAKKKSSISVNMTFEIVVASICYAAYFVLL